MTITGNEIAELQEQIARLTRERDEAQAQRDDVDYGKRPIALTSETLATIMARVMADVDAQRTKKARTTMPPPGSLGAPAIFDGTKPAELPTFFKNLEECFDEAGITEDAAKVKLTARYTMSRAREWIEHHEAFECPNYNELKTALLAAFDNPQRKVEYTSEDLNALVKIHQRQDVRTLEELCARDMEFDLVTKSLIRRSLISDDIRDRRYFESFSDNWKDKLRSYLLIKKPDHPRDRPHSIDTVKAAVRYLLMPGWEDERIGDPRILTDRIMKEVSKEKAKAANEPVPTSRLQQTNDLTRGRTAPSSSDLDQLVNRMQNLSLDDPEYARTYAALIVQYPRYATIVKPPYSQISQPTTPTMVSTTVTTTQAGLDPNREVTYLAQYAEWPQTRCYWCFKEGCGLRSCPTREQDRRDGLVIEQEGTWIGKAGRRLRRANPGGFHADAVGQAATHRTAMMTTMMTTRDTPPHLMTAAYEVVSEESDWLGLNGAHCIRIEDEDVDAYELKEDDAKVLSVSDVREQVETYFTTMIQEGVDNEVARNAAWSLAAATKPLGKAKTAARSANPYAKDDKKGKGKVRFDEHDPSIPPAVREATRPTGFPVQTPVTINVAAPSSTDWPRGLASSQDKTGSTSATVENAGSSFRTSTGAPIPEIDMTSKDTARFRLASEIEETRDAEAICNDVYKQVVVSVPFLDLLALSPPMRARITDMTRKKRVPTMTTSKPTTVARTTAAIVTEDGGKWEDGEIVVAATTIMDPNRRPRYSAKLPKLSCEIGNVSAIGLLDSGSQINLMTEEFWARTGLPINSTRKISMQGVSLSTERSLGVCENVPIPMGNCITRAHIHVFEKGPFSFLLGQPWIQDHLIAHTESGSVAKALIRDFVDPANRVTIVLRNDANVRIDEVDDVVHAPSVPLSATIQVLDQSTRIDAEDFDKLEGILWGTGDRVDRNANEDITFWSAAPDRGISPNPEETKAGSRGEKSVSWRILTWPHQDERETEEEMIARRDEARLKRAMCGMDQEGERISRDIEEETQKETYLRTAGYLGGPRTASDGTPLQTTSDTRRCTLEKKSRLAVDSDDLPPESESDGEGADLDSQPSPSRSEAIQGLISKMLRLIDQRDDLPPESESEDKGTTRSLPTDRTEGRDKRRTIEKRTRTASQILDAPTTPESEDKIDLESESVISPPPQHAKL